MNLIYLSFFENHCSAIKKIFKQDLIPNKIGPYCGPKNESARIYSVWRCDNGENCRTFHSGHLAAINQFFYKIIS